jgi:hypothetical protein
MSNKDKKFGLSDPGKTSINKALIASRGDAMVEQVNQEISNTKLVLADEDARMHVFQRIKELVDQDSSGLDDVEKGILSKYVRAVIFGWESSQQFLAQVPDTNVTVQSNPFQNLYQSLEKDDRGKRGILHFVKRLIVYSLMVSAPISNRTKFQQFVGVAVPVLSATWLTLLIISFCCGENSFGLLTSFPRFIVMLILSCGSLLGRKFAFTVTLVLTVVLPGLYVWMFIIVRWNLWLAALLLPKHPLLFSKLSIGFWSDRLISRDNAR